MPTLSSLDDNKKLAVTYRVEEGCLGPSGHTHIDKFCEFAQENIQNPSANFIKLIILPRHDKSLPEIQFNVLSKKINHLQAEKYLSLFGQSLDDFECELSDQLTQFIQTYAKEFIK
tara:strand:+ start:2184 stop:2531 length:348 start_codon:yes stop_codon:yes gene_type:complete